MQEWRRRRRHVEQAPASKAKRSKSLSFELMQRSREGCSKQQGPVSPSGVPCTDDKSGLSFEVAKWQGFRLVLGVKEAS